VSRTNHNTKGPGYEYWASRLYCHGETPGRWTKVQTHRKERRAGREVCKVVLEDSDADS